MSPYLQLVQQTLKSLLNLLGTDLSLLYRVNLSIVLLRQTEGGLFGSSISDLKAWFRTRKYVLNTLKFSEQNADPVFIKCTIYQVSWGESILLFAKFNRV